ncbi:MAG: type II toxin-antitoxin system Phd/YefM family antitoxin [Anaerolineales bacterium]
MPEIGVYKLKTHVSEIMRAVQAGERFIITHRGRPVGILAPVGEAASEESNERAWDDFWRLADEIGQIEPVDRRPSVEILAEMRR